MIHLSLKLLLPFKVFMFYFLRREFAFMDRCYSQFFCFYSWKLLGKSYLYYEEMNLQRKRTGFRFVKCET